MKTHQQLAITINGVRLTEGQSMTVHVALNSFACDLRENGLGEDEHGKAMVEGYLRNIAEIQNLYIP